MHDSHNAKTGENGESGMNVVQISQGFSYKLCSSTSLHFLAFGLFISKFGMSPLYTGSLLLCYKDI